jgi:hypothetical protein
MYITGHTEVVDLTGKGLGVQLFLIVSNYFLSDFLLKFLDFESDIKKELDRLG